MFILHTYICTMGKSIFPTAQGRPCGSRGGHDALDPDAKGTR